MIYLLDTNVVSEAMHRRPNAQVMAWLLSLPVATCAISTLTLGELRKGAEKPGIDTLRRERLRQWLAHDLRQWLGSNILPVDEAIAEQWGQIMAVTPRTLAVVDALIAATALHHGLRLVTRNVADFRDIAGLEIINPWD